jgi:(R,R)-butanediol dehydrogenase/meso-butanediol dehydrogenase/diacetyl reductase
MKAAVFDRPGAPLRVASIADPEPRDDGVVIRVRRCGVCGTDLHMTEDHGGEAAAPGSIFGHEYAGEVVAIGKRVSGLRIGDAVAALPLAACGRCHSCRAGDPLWCAGMRLNYGGFAEHVGADAASCVRLPASASVEDGALVEPLSVARHGVETAGPLAGKSVLVIGAGPIGLGVAYWARRAGAGHIAVLEKLRSRADLACRIGADSAADPAGSFALGRQPDQPPDIVFECAGVPALLDMAVACVRPKGRIQSLGFCLTTAPFRPSAANLKEVTIAFPLGYSVADFEAAIDAFEEGDVAPRDMVTGRVALDDFPEAFEALRLPGAHCKLMVAP